MNASLKENSDVGEIVRKMESDFVSGTTHVSKYVDVSLYDDINRIYAYLESKHTTGDTDSLDREKPFFNIVLAARNIWFRATDIDRSNIKIRPTKEEDDLGTFLATIHLQNWMRRENFGQFLNSWGINMAGFNESVVKFVEKGGKLIPSVVPWNRIICDQIDFASNPKVELLELTEAQLRKRKEFDQELVDKLCIALESRKTFGKQTKDNKSNYIRLYEVHGELPVSCLTGNEDDEDEYTQQMHVITFIASKDNGKYDDYTLFAGREAKDPYLLTALLPEVDGSVALRGSVKTLFDAQWMQNHTAKAIKDQLDLASKLIFQTSDPTFVGQNVLTAIENGDILIHRANEPLTQIANTSHDITSLQNFGVQWKQLGNEITGISESMLGATAPSGTAWRQVDQLLQESHSLFELMTENKGLYVEEMLREFVIPHLKKKMDTTDEVTATLKAHDISKIDARYIKNTSIQAANRMAKEKILNGEEVTPEEQELFAAAHASTTQEKLSEQGNQRYFSPSLLKDKTWKEVFKDLEWEVEADITNESMDKDALTTLNTMMQTLAQNPNILQDPNMRMLWNKILSLTGAVSPLEIVVTPPPPPPEQQYNVSESISFKDLPEQGRIQMARQAGIKLDSAPDMQNQPTQTVPPPGQPQATAGP